MMLEIQVLIEDWRKKYGGGKVKDEEENKRMQ